MQKDGMRQPNNPSASFGLYLIIIIIKLSHEIALENHSYSQLFGFSFLTYNSKYHLVKFSPFLIVKCSEQSQTSIHNLDIQPTW